MTPGAVLDQLIGGNIFALMLVFIRLGTAFLVLPTVGEFLVPQRVRLGLAFLICLLVLPLLRPSLPTQPATPADLTTMVIIESFLGLFIGLLPRLMLGGLEVAGMVVAQQSGLSNAFVYNPALASQGSVPGAFLAWAGLILILATDMHHMLLRAVVESYMIFPAGRLPLIGDMTGMVMRVVADSFRIGVEMATPFLATGLVFSLALGVISRLAPQIQVFMVFTSIQPFYGLFVFVGIIGAAIIYWLRQFDALIVEFLLP